MLMSMGLLNACSSDDGILSVSQAPTQKIEGWNTPSTEMYVEMPTYNQEVSSNKNTITDFCIKNEETSTTIQEDEAFKATFLPTAKKFVDKLGITYADINAEIPLYSQSDYEYAIIGLLLFASSIDKAKTIEVGGIMPASFGILECMAMVSGVNDFVQLVGSVSKGQMSRTAIIRCLRIVARLGGKTALRYASGIGLALMAAEVIDCAF